MRRFVAILCILFVSTTASAAVIGLDGLHAFNANALLSSGSNHSTFRSIIAGMGHTIVPINGFSAAELSGVDAAFIVNAYNQNAHSFYSDDEMTAVRNFAGNNAVFLSDLTIFVDPGLPNTDRSITFGDNLRLLENIISFVAGSHGVVFIGENGTGFNIANYNNLVAPYGVSYSGTAMNGNGHTVNDIVPHALTAGVHQLGVDFHLPLTITGPAIDLTVGDGNDNVLAFLPEPASLTLVLISIPLLRRGRRRQSS